MSSPMNAAADRFASTNPGATGVQWLLGVILVGAPLFKSGQPALAVMELELLAVLLLILVLWQRRLDLVTRPEAIGLTLLFVTPLLYLIPLPAGLAEWIPGREAYRNALSLMDGASADSAATLSLYPLETEAAWLVLLLPVGVYLGARMLDSGQVFRLVLLLLGIGAAQSLLGVLQYGAGEGSPELFGMSLPDVRSASGTYTNRNHLAGLLELLLPVAIALTIFSIGRRQGAETRSWRRRVAFFGSMQGHTALMYGAISVLFLVGVIYTRSRGGISLSMLGVLLSTVLFARRIGGDNVYGPAGTIVTLTVGIGLAIGLGQVLDRFSVATAVNDARWPILSSTMEGIGAFSPIGSGPGSYPDVYPLFQPLELGRWFINHAHNDYAEWLFEGGLIAAALILLFLVLFLRQWGRVWTRDTWSRSRFVQIGAGIGILLLALHSLVDYNLHIPANIAYFAFMAGIFFSEPATEVEAAVRKRKPRRTPNLEDATEILPLPVASGATTPPREQIKNPFLD